MATATEQRWLPIPILGYQSGGSLSTFPLLGIPVAAIVTFVPRVMNAKLPRLDTASSFHILLSTYMKTFTASFEVVLVFEADDIEHAKLLAQEHAESQNRWTFLEIEENKGQVLFECAFCGARKYSKEEWRECMKKHNDEAKD